MSKPAKTINQRYSLKQRKEIARHLRLVTSRPGEEMWLYTYMNRRTVRYLKAVLWSYKQTSFCGFLESHGIDWRKQHPNKKEAEHILYHYCWKALNRLADELDPPKEQSK